jgi:hypothetical protein
MKEEASNPIPSVNPIPQAANNQNVVPNAISIPNPGNLTGLKETK